MSAAFVDLGLDSLFLTQASQALSKEFGVGVTFRQLNETLTSVDALYAHLVGQGITDSPKPEEPAPSIQSPQIKAEPTIRTPATHPIAVPMPAPGNSGGLGAKTEDLIRAQIALMQYQLQILSGHGQAGSVAASTTQAAVESVASATAAPVKPQVAVSSDRGQPNEAAEAVEPPKGGRGARITKSVDAKLSARQGAFLSDLVEQYTRKTPRSKEYTQKHRAHLADPRTVSGFHPLYKELVYPLVTNRSKGSRIWDLDGNEYIDHVCGFGPILFGHSPDFIVSAAQEQIVKGVETGPQAELAGEVAELVCEMTGLERCAFASTGSEAVLGALRLARTVTGRDKIVMFEGAYHGIVDEVIYRRSRQGAGLPAAPGIPREALANVIVLPWNDLGALDAITAIADDLAAVLVEPVQSRAPEIQPRELLHRLRAICDQTGAALIMDEMITGFRMHPGGAQAYFGVRADLATYGKIVGGGYPIGIIGGSSRFMDALDGGYWSFGDESTPTVGVTYFAGTFVRHPVALAASRAVLLELRRHGPALQAGLTSKTATLIDELRGFLASVSSPIQINNCTSWFCVTAPKEEVFMPLFFAMMRLKGFHVQEGRPFFLTTAHSAEDLAAFASAFRESITDLMLHDFLSGDKLAAHREAKRVADRPPVEGARLGRDEHGNPGWYVKDPDRPNKYLKVTIKN